jgi:hypothetical protein
MLARRLGVSVHCSPLGFKAKRLARQHAIPLERLDEWLVDLANHRDARVVVRRVGRKPEWPDLPSAQLSNEELVVLICQPQRADHAQILRLAAQLVSRGSLDLERLFLTARRERADRVLGELARLALRVDPSHATWNTLARMLHGVAPLRDPILHWSRLAEPVPTHGVCDGKSWRLVA